jgi:protoporphyrinogen oxidase
MLGEEFLLRSRMSRIHYRGKFFDYPFKATNALANLGPVEAFLVMLSYSKSKILPSHEETNFEQWVSNRFGQRLYEIFFKTYTEKVWGIPCKEISADWAAQRIKNLSLHEAIRNALFGAGRAKDGEIITTLIDSFHYPRFGPGMMWEHCEEKLNARGNETLRGIFVDQIRHRNGHVECVYGHNTKDERVEFGAEHFISTMPLRSLIRALTPAPPDRVLEAANYLRYRDYLTVVLITQRESVFPDNWIYIHSPEVKMGRIQNYKNWSPEMVPDKSRTSLGLEYFLWDKDDEWNWSNDRLIELGIRECAQIGLIQPDEVEDGTVVRMKKAYPVYDQKYQESVEILKNYLGTFDNLQTVGRNGLHRYNNQDHSMLTGVYAARNIAGEQNDVWSVNTEMEYHEEIRESSQTGDRSVPQRIVPVGEVPSTASAQISADAVIEEVFARLDPVALGTSVSIVCAVGLFLATAILLLKGGEVVGPTLGLLDNYLIGYSVTWTGAFIGLFEAGVIGFVLGAIVAWTRNLGMDAYAYLLRRRAVAEAEREVLDKV